jgi:hypothetical protein
MGYMPERLAGVILHPSGHHFQVKNAMFQR